MILLIERFPKGGKISILFLNSFSFTPVQSIFIRFFFNIILALPSNARPRDLRITAIEKRQDATSESTATWRIMTDNCTTELHSAGDGEYSVPP